MNYLLAGVVITGLMAFLVWLTFCAIARLREPDAVVNITGDGRGRALPPFDEAEPNQLRTWEPPPGPSNIVVRGASPLPPPTNVRNQ